MGKEKSETKVCKHCKSEIPAGAKVCPHCRKKQGGGILKYILLVFAILIVIGIVFGNDDGKETDSSVFDNGDQEEQHEVSGVEIKNSGKNKSEILNDFSYELSENKIIFEKYNGKSEILEIKASYEINGTKYKTDLSDFQIGSGNQNVTTLILCNGIKKVNNSIFNSSDVEKVYFPKSMKVIHDNTLAYLHPRDGEKIKIFYGGTRDEWENIFEEYKRTPVEDAEFGEELGKAAADKLNEMMGMEYDSSLFEYFFSSSPDDLK